MSQFAPHRARKRFGQHFLHDANVIANIIDAIDPVPGQPLVEVGPGLGALTLPLLAECERLHVVELDRDVIPRLEAACVGRGELIVHQGDALSYDFGILATELGAPLRLVGNLPYNISTPLLFHFLSARHALHAAERSGGPHGGRAQLQRLWTAHRHAGGQGTRGKTIRCGPALVQPAAQGRQFHRAPRAARHTPLRDPRPGLVRRFGRQGLLAAPQDLAQLGTGHRASRGFRFS